MWSGLFQSDQSSLDCVPSLVPVTAGWASLRANRPSDSQWCRLWWGGGEACMSETDPSQMRKVQQVSHGENLHNLLS